MQITKFKPSQVFCFEITVSQEAVSMEPVEGSIVIKYLNKEEYQMKKVLLAALTCAMILSFATFGTMTASAEESGGYTIAWATMGLSNPVWANTLNHAIEFVEGKGDTLIYADAGDDPAKQVSQIENFIESGVDAIIIQALDPNSLDDVCKLAGERGIYTVDFNRYIENATCHLNADLEEGGRMLARMAAEWIEENYGDEEIEVGLLDIQTSEVGLMESQACQAEFAEVAPNAKIVSILSTLTLEEGVTNTEAMMNSNPNIKVIMGCSSGAGIGGNTVLCDLLPESEWDKFGLFSFDATEEECLAIKDGVIKGSISPQSGERHAELLLDMAYRCLAGEEVETEWLDFKMIREDNVDDYLKEAYGYE